MGKFEKAHSTLSDLPPLHSAGSILNGGILDSRSVCVCVFKTTTDHGSASFKSRPLEVGRTKQLASSRPTVCSGLRLTLDGLNERDKSWGSKLASDLNHHQSVTENISIMHVLISRYVCRVQSWGHAFQGYQKNRLWQYSWAGSRSVQQVCGPTQDWRS